MWFFGDKKKPAEQPTPEVTETEEAAAPPSERAEVELEAAVDTAGAMLRSMGKHAFDLDEREARGITEQFEAWAQHILSRAPEPGTERAAGAAVHRHWSAARSFFANHRKAEGQYVNKTLQDLRAVVWAFIHSLGRVVGTTHDGRVKSQLERLRTAVQTGSTENLKREAQSVADTIAAIVEERSRQQAEEMAALGERLTTLGTELEQVRREVERDALTKLLNRGAFDECIARTSDLCNVFGHPACLMLLDVDHFKKVNDTYGHPAGDEVLRKLSDALSRTFLRKGDFVARYGGEEFAVVLRDTAAQHASPLAQRLLQAVRGLQIPIEGRGALKVTISVGVAAANRGETAGAWLDRADKALYQAKQAGRNRVVLADPA